MSKFGEKFTKHDAGRLRPSLLPELGLEEVAQVLEYGARKYGANNWDKCEDPRRYHDAARRHMAKYNNARQRDHEDADEESGLSHLGHAAACLLILIELERMKRGDTVATWQYRGKEPPTKSKQPGVSGVLWSDEMLEELNREGGVASPREGHYRATPGKASPLYIRPVEVGVDWATAKRVAERLTTSKRVAERLTLSLPGQRLSTEEVERELDRMAKAGLIESRVVEDDVRWLEYRYVEK